ncbi:hypothetical protein MPSEU_000740900 [Mayamaea pseudoterrestris]|nr:hypothetical protein MPSEU_000740900 [Mayamaea pseudoterrestris]
MLKILATLPLLLLIAAPNVFADASTSRAAANLALSLGQQFDRWSSRRRTTDNDAVILASSVKSRSESRGGSSLAIKSMTAKQKAAFNLFSGGAAGTVASTLTNPLDVIKTQLQSSEHSRTIVTETGEIIRRNKHALGVAQQIMRDDGLAGFWRGLPPTLVGIIPSRSVYFYAYQKMKHLLGKTSPKHFSEGSPPNALVAGFMAGIAGNTITNPIWMVRTRMQLHADKTAGQHAYNGYVDAISTIFREEGLAGFYKGITASYWGCAEGACQFLLYEDLQRRLLKRINRRRLSQGLKPTKNLSNAHYFWCAAASKMCATIATYPHEVARTRMREQAREGIFRYTGMWQTLALIAKEEGASSMYAGMGVHLMKVVPNSAFMFLTYEIVKSWLGEFQVVN